MTDNDENLSQSCLVSRHVKVRRDRTFYDHKLINVFGTFSLISHRSHVIIFGDGTKTRSSEAMSGDVSCDTSVLRNGGYEETPQ